MRWNVTVNETTAAAAGKAITEGYDGGDAEDAVKAAAAAVGELLKGGSFGKGPHYVSVTGDTGGKGKDAKAWLSISIREGDGGEV